MGTRLDGSFTVYAVHVVTICYDICACINDLGFPCLFGVFGPGARPSSVLSCLALSCLVLSCLVLPCFVLSCLSMLSMVDSLGNLWCTAGWAGCGNGNGVGWAGFFGWEWLDGLLVTALGWLDFAFFVMKTRLVGGYCCLLEREHTS